MATMLIQHKVKDYASWKKGFDAALTMRKSFGELSAQIFHDVNDPNLVTVLNKWDSLANAEKFVHSPDLKAGMEQAGVIGMPTVTFLNED